MELRTLHYFLAVAREGNMTGAANMLHITQPTLSRQMADLEKELGKQLFIRTNRNTHLTAEGIHLRQRAEEILSLVRQTEAEINNDQLELTGCIRIGAGETPVIHFLTDAFARLHSQHPGVTCELFTGNADTVEERLVHSLIDFALFIEPFNPEKYEYLRLPETNTVGIITRSDNPWAKLPAITPDILKDIPLLTSSRTATAAFDVRTWSGGQVTTEDLQIVGRFDLIANAAQLIRTGITSAIGINEFFQLQTPDLAFVPLKPAVSFSCLVVWKKYQLLTKPCEVFLRLLKESCPHTDTENT